MVFAPLLEDDEPRAAEIEEQENEIEALRKDEYNLASRLEHLDRLWSTRRRLLVDDVGYLRNLRESREEHLNILRHPPEDELPPPGPASLRWVDGSIFSGICTLVILSNLGTMIVQMWSPKEAANLWMADQIFLVFYLIELVLKWRLHQYGFLIGPLSVVWWNWLDLLIVASGVVDQWCQPLLKSSGLIDAGHNGVHTGGLRVLRLLRLVRVVRVLKIVRIFLQTDLSWTESGYFQSFITGVIALNALTLGMELDIHWDGWFWVEEAMQTIYFFELAVRGKRHGWNFFIHPEDWAWNNLDFIIVMGGVLEQWMMPLYRLIMSLVTGTAVESAHSGGSLLPLLRMLRLLRILRLLRLLKSLKPLYKLSLGVLEAMQAMQWVLVLTFVLLYAAAILFTSLVGHGLMVGVKINRESRHVFGSVLESMFMLFKVMNGDQSAMEPLLRSVQFKLLFILFMVVSNWMVLAILTAVVSENMISATDEHARMEKEEEDTRKTLASSKELMRLFHTIDTDNDGMIDEPEFDALMEEEALRNQFCDATGLEVRDLKDLFAFLSRRHEDGLWKIDYEVFVEKLQNEGKDVSERSIFRLERQMRQIERRIDAKLDSVRSELRQRNAQEKTSHLHRSGKQFSDKEEKWENGSKTQLSPAGRFSR